MGTIFDAFLDSEAKMSQIQNQDLVNQSILAKLEAEKRAVAETEAVKRTLANLNAQQNQQPTGLQSLVEVPDAAAESMGERKIVPQNVPQPKPNTAQSLVESNMAQALDYENKARAIEALRPELAKDFRKEADTIRTRIASLQKESRQEQIDAYGRQLNALAAVKDEQTLNVMAPQLAKDFPGLFDARAQDGSPIFQKGLDGRYLFTNQLAAMRQYAEDQIVGQKTVLENQQKAEDMALKRDQEKRAVNAQEETVRHNKATESNAREGNRIKEKEIDRKVDEEASPLSKEALDSAAASYRATGQLPAIGIGRNAAATKQQILNRAAEMAASEGESAEEQNLRKISNKANVTALQQLVKQQTMVGAFEKNAIRNADIALNVSEKVDRSGVPAINRWINAGRKELAGDPEMSRFHAATTTFVNEYAKIMSGSMGNTVVSDSLRKETESLLATKDTPQQFKATIDLMKQEMRNRMKGFEDQKNELMQSTKSKAQQSKEPAKPEEKAASQFVEGQVYQDSAGNKAKYVNGQWVPQ